MASFLFPKSSSKRSKTCWKALIRRQIRYSLFILSSPTTSASSARTTSHRRRLVHNSSRTTWEDRWVRVWMKHPFSSSWFQTSQSLNRMKLLAKWKVRLTMEDSKWTEMRDRGRNLWSREGNWRIQLRFRFWSSIKDIGAPGRIYVNKKMRITKRPQTFMIGTNQWRLRLSRNFQT